MCVDAPGHVAGGVSVYTGRMKRYIVISVLVLALILILVARPRLLWHPYTGGSGCLEFKCGDTPYGEYWFDAWCCPGGCVLACVSVGYGWNPERGFVNQKSWMLKSPWWRPPANAGPSRIVTISRP